jgi:hypothetical protein
MPCRNGSLKPPYLLAHYLRLLCRYHLAAICTDVNNFICNETILPKNINSTTHAIGMCRKDAR